MFNAEAKQTSTDKQRLQEHPARQGPWAANLCGHEEQMWTEKDIIIQVNKNKAKNNNNKNNDK